MLMLDVLKRTLQYKSPVAFALACPYFFLTILSVLALAAYLASTRLRRESETREVLKIPITVYGGTWMGATFLLLLYELFVSVCMRYAQHRPVLLCGRSHNQLCPPYPFPLWDHTLKHVLQVGTVGMGVFLIGVSLAIIGWGAWSGIRAGVRVTVARIRAQARGTDARDDGDENGFDD